MPMLFRSDCRILIVEDEYVLAYQLKRALEGEGVTVLGPVASEDDARALIERSGTVDGVVLDLNLGGRVTYGLADYLLEKGIRFLFATGYDESAIAPHYRAVPYTQKPVSAAFVAEALGCGSAK